MTPGATTCPAASISIAVRVGPMSPTATIRSPLTATSARTPGMPVPSTTVPPRMTMSKCSMASIPVRGDRCAGVQRAALSDDRIDRSEEHTSELQSLMRISYAVFCLKKKNTRQQDKIKSKHEEQTKLQTNNQT